MKFVCNKCKKLIDEEDIIINIGDTGIRMFIDVYCPLCYDELNIKREKRIEKLQEKVKSKKWWQIVNVDTLMKE